MKKEYVPDILKGMLLKGMLLLTKGLYIVYKIAYIHKKEKK